MRIKQISITDKGKKLSISWYSGEEDNTLNTVSGTDKPLPSFKECGISFLSRRLRTMRLAGTSGQKRPCGCRRWYL